MSGIILGIITGTSVIVVSILFAVILISFMGGT